MHSAGRQAGSLVLKDERVETSCNFSTWKCLLLILKDDIIHLTLYMAELLARWSM